MMDKFKFWKKSEDIGSSNDLGKIGGDLPGGAPNFGSGLDSSGLPRSQVGPPPAEPPIDTFSDGQILMPRPQPQPSSPFPQQQSQPFNNYSNKDLEIVSAKLDALRISLDNISQRIANLERIAYGEQENSRR